MAFLRQVVAPFLIFLVFLVALLAVSARIFLPNDMAEPAPMVDVETDAVSQLPEILTGEGSDGKLLNKIDIS